MAESMRCPTLWSGGPLQQRAADPTAEAQSRCVYPADHPGWHRWPNGCQLRYVEGFDVVLVPDPAVDAWAAGRAPTFDDGQASDVALRDSRDKARRAREVSQ